MRLLRNSLAALLLLTAPALAQEEIPEGPLVQAQLLLHAPGVKANELIRAGVLFTIPEGWHIYWQNPGDSGIPTTLAWTLPDGVSASEIIWPVPQRHDMGGIYNYGFSDRVILPVNLLPTRDDASGTVTVKAEWLVCKEICIPESATLTGELPHASPQAQTLLSNREAEAPRALPGRAYYSATPETITLRLALDTDLGDSEAGSFFPIEDGVITNASSQGVLYGGNAESITLQFARGGSALPPVWHGVFATNSGAAYHVAAEQETAAAAPGAPADHASLLVLLGLAMLGGLLLNLMPCVLPILSLKALALAKKSGAEQRAARAQGVAYTLGVVATFLAIAGLMLALKAGGAAIGWGFQLQEPGVIAALFFLTLLVALNLFGWFELPVLFGNRLGNMHSARGAFLTGALAVMLATPCTAPFMATAVGATLTLPAAQSLLVFAALGLGMAAPFLMISLWPAARAWLPKPGSWMVRFKQFLAFPMLATGAWLLWVLVQINGSMGLALVLAATVLLTFVIWLAHGRKHRRLYWLAVLVLVVWAIAAQPSPQAASEHAATPFSEAALQELRDKGTPVFVDATAAWCITCKINERVALQDSSVQEAFAQKGVVLMVADWTTRDANITAYLAKFGRNGVPLYVYYGPKSEPVVLPQILTPSSVRAVLGN